MLSISNKSMYGLRAVLELAENYDKGLLRIKEIAARKEIPRQYLEQIFNQLVKANIIQSVRGKNGGYKLARSPVEITVAEIFSILEGGIEFVPAAGDPTDVVFELFHGAEEKLLETLRITLAELISRQEKLREVFVYTI